MEKMVTQAKTLATRAHIAEKELKKTKSQLANTKKAEEEDTEQAKEEKA